MEDEVKGVVKRMGAAHISFASGRHIVLPAAMLEEIPVTGGMRADPDVLEAQAAARAPAYCLRQVLLWQSGRDHAASEMRQRLRMMGYPPEAADGALEKMQESGIVSDRRYCESLVRRKKRNRGREALLTEMRARGVDEDTARSALETEMDAEEEFRGALRTAEGLMKRGKDRDRVFLALRRRGYSRGMSIRALEAAEAGEE